MLTTWLIALAIGAWMGPAGAQALGEAFKLEARIYQVLTNVTGNGLTSQTLPGPQGWLQVVHQRLDDVELVMEGETLTWNGAEAPDYERIIPISMPTLITNLNSAARIRVGSDGVQYMERNATDLYELRSAEEEAGLSLGFTPERLIDAKGVVEGSLDFDFVWVKDREEIEGVALDVGKPIMGQAAGKGTVQMRLGEWSCYQVPVGSEGWIYVFVRLTSHEDKAVTPTLTPEPGDLTGEALRPSGGTSDTTGRGPKVEVGGSVRIRGNYYSNQ
jgi:hypothetical protein